MVAELALVEGPRDDAMRRARDIVAYRGLEQRPFDELDALCDALVVKGIDGSRTILDFGLARGISYYSGVIFELYHPALTGALSLGGGGRYDGLVKALGGGDVPALGFAYGLEQVVKALEHERSVEAGTTTATSRT
jgi:histidyl-tRNA synthetase